jgi:hypothetical protein
LSEKKKEENRKEQRRKRPSALIKVSDAADGFLSTVCILRNFRIVFMVLVLVEKLRGYARKSVELHAFDM